MARHGTVESRRRFARFIRQNVAYRSFPVGSRPFFVGQGLGPWRSLWLRTQLGAMGEFGLGQFGPLRQAHTRGTIEGQWRPDRIRLASISIQRLGCTSLNFDSLTGSNVWPSGAAQARQCEAGERSRITEAPWYPPCYQSTLLPEALVNWPVRRINVLVIYAVQDMLHLRCAALCSERGCLAQMAPDSLTTPSLPSVQSTSEDYCFTDILQSRVTRHGQAHPAGSDCHRQGHPPSTEVLNEEIDQQLWRTFAIRSAQETNTSERRCSHWQTLGS